MISVVREAPQEPDVGEILKPAHCVYVAELLLEDNLRDNVRKAALARDPELLPVAVMDVGYWSQLHDWILPWILWLRLSLESSFSTKNGKNLVLSA